VAPAKSGDTVKVHYTGKLEDGTVFDSSAERDPLEFTLGGGQIIPGFEKAVMGMETGASKTITIPPDDAYGPHRDDMVMEVERSKLPPNFDPNVGSRLQIPQPQGRPVDVVVSEVSDTHLTLDANHPLAGKDLIFEIELVEIG
jgi:FKBP-type peptidyl-prolyl cis-trans isomerase 2